ncbi:MAG: transglycosylase domain-containing protein, partial [Cyanobacteria bacterium]|nr:transglycosylase domain-containing protein [Cyanobacteriota bacterium]
MPSSQARQPQKSIKSKNNRKTSVRLSKRAKILLSSMLGVSVIAIAIGAMIVPKIFNMRGSFAFASLPSLKQLGHGIEIYDAKDRLVYKLKEHGDQEVVPIDLISKNMHNAIVAAEDHRFYEHSGVDPVGIARAAKRNQEEGHVVEGGSTITQQVVRNLYLNPKDKSYARKLVESMIALNVDQRYSKKKILETYLNVVYFGEGAYGIESASRYYFGKPAKNLSLAESAFLAGLIKAPSVLGAERNRDAAIARQRDVLASMQEYGMASYSDLRKARGEKLNFTRRRDDLKFGHYISAVTESLRKELGDKMWSGDWKVYTHLDLKAQEAAERTMNQGLQHTPRGLNQGALVSLDLETGGVKALVGGVGSYRKNKWNRATHPHTVGSVMKPFVYLAALADGLIKPDT